MPVILNVFCDFISYEHISALDILFQTLLLHKIGSIFGYFLVAACLGHFINLKPSFNSVFVWFVFVFVFELCKVFHMSIIVQDLPGRFFKPHLTYSHKFFFSSIKRYLFPALSCTHTHTDTHTQGSESLLW